MSCGYAIASPADRLMAPFLVPKGLPETDVAAKLFENFKVLYGLFTRAAQATALKSQQAVNRARYARTFAPGETVFRRLPGPGRLPKHLFPEPSTGPYRRGSRKRVYVFELFWMGVF